jgi:hypothetical protein
MAPRVEIRTANGGSSTENRSELVRRPCASCASTTALSTRPRALVPRIAISFLVFDPRRGRSYATRGVIGMQSGLRVVAHGVIAGISASFATPDDNEQVAKAGLAALGE